MTLLVATTNRHKLAEIRALLRDVPIELVGLEAFPPIDPPEETGRTFEENARLKAGYYASATGALTVAEDSGLEIDALGGAPGVESARFGGVDLDYPGKFALIYRQLADVPQAARAARFVCALALSRDGAIVFETRGTIEGQIADAPRGQGGFGYDPIFFYPPYGRTLGEATNEEKAAVSHRGHAFRALGGFLRSHV